MFFKRWVLVFMLLAGFIPLFCSGPQNGGTRTWDNPGSMDPQHNWGQLKKYALNDVIGAIKGYTLNNIHNFSAFALWLFGIFVTIELVKEAINIAQGGGFKLPTKVINWLVLMVIIYSLSGKFTEGVFSGAMSFSESTLDRFEVVIENYFENCSSNDQSTGIWSAIWNTVSHPIKSAINGTAIGMAVLIGGLSIVLIYVMLLGVFATLGILLLIGPVAIAFMAIDFFKDAGIRWINSIITNLLMLFFYGILLGMVGEVLSVSLKRANQSMTYASLAANVIIIIIGPIIGLSIVFQGPKTVIQILGGVGSSTASWMAGTTGAIAAMATRKFAGMGKKGSWNDLAGIKGKKSEGGQGGGEKGGQSGGGGGNAGNEKKNDNLNKNAEGASENGSAKNSQSPERGGEGRSDNIPEKGGEVNKEDLSKGQKLKKMGKEDMSKIAEGGRRLANRILPNEAWVGIAAGKTIARAAKYGKTIFAPGAQPKAKNNDKEKS